MSDAWARIRACVEWIRTSELAVRAFIRQHCPSMWQRGVRPQLSQILFLPNQNARLLYDYLDGVVTVQMNPAGQFVAGPIVNEVRNDEPDTPD